MSELAFDVIPEAEKALDAGASSRETAQRFAIHAVRQRQMSAFENLLRAFDQDSASLELARWLATVVDDGLLVLSDGRAA